MAETVAQKTKRAPGGRLFDSVARELYVRNAELAVRTKALSLLRRLDETALASLETEAMAHNIATILTEELSFPMIAIALVQPEQKSLMWRAISCTPSNAIVCSASLAKEIPFRFSENRCVQVVQTRRPCAVHSLKHVLTPSFPAAKIAAYERSMGIKSALLYPLSAHKEALGVLVIGLNRSRRDLTRFEQETLEGAVSLVTVAVQKAQTYTSLKETTAKLAAANNKLQELDALKTEFLSIASHQLRTPLAVTKGYAAMMTQHMLGPLSKKQLDAMQKITRSTEELISLVNHLLDVSRIEAGRLVLRVGSVCLAPLVHEVVDFLASRAKEKGVVLSVAGEGKIYVQADQDKLKEILMNYIDNAIKYTPSGNISIAWKQEGQLIRFSVADTGFGLTKSDLSHLFEKFSRGSASNQVSVSTGLGLYVCRRLAEAMGGRVWAESRGKGKGSTFFLALPLTKAPKSR